MAKLKGLTERNISAFILWDIENQDTAAWVDQVSGAVNPSDQIDEDFYAIGAVNPLTRAQGQRKAKALRADTVTVVNEVFESSLLVKRIERKLDKTQQVERRINDLSLRAAQHWERLSVETIKLGESTVCFDGQFFFDTDHVTAESGTQSNDLSGGVNDIVTPTAPTVAEAEASIWNAVTAMMDFLDDTGEPMHGSEKNFTILIPPVFLRAFSGALGNQIIAEGGAGVSNTLSTGGFNFTLEANAWLSTALGAAAWTTKWALFAGRGRAIIRAEEQEPTVTAKAEGSDFEHDNLGDHEYGVFASRGAGYGAWQDAIITTFS